MTDFTSSTDQGANLHRKRKSRSAKRPKKKGREARPRKWKERRSPQAAGAVAGEKETMGQTVWSSLADVPTMSRLIRKGFE